jgi:hypothetical protein
MITYYESQQEKYGLQLDQEFIEKKSVTGRSVRVTLPYKRNQKYAAKRIKERQMPKKVKKIKRIVNIRLRPDQEERINAIVERSAILDTSKFVRIAVDWLLRSDIGEVIKEIVHDENHFPDYQIPKKPTGRKKWRR